MRLKSLGRENSETYKLEVFVARRVVRVGPILGLNMGRVTQRNELCALIFIGYEENESNEQERTQRSKENLFVLRERTLKIFERRSQRLNETKAKK